MEKVNSFEEFQEIIAHLRAPEGCPWDREQTHLSLRNNLLEETYETLEVIDRQDVAGMREEFGDLLLQIVLHAQIAAEAGEFSMEDVIAGISQQAHPAPSACIWRDRSLRGAECPSELGKAQAKGTGG